MRKSSMFAAAAFFVLFGAMEARAANPNVPTWSPYALMDSGAPPAAEQAPMAEGRAASAAPAPGVMRRPNYRRVGLSSRPGDCNKGCAVSNGS